jgi:hypothetical protein
MLNKEVAKKRKNNVKNNVKNKLLLQSRSIKKSIKIKTQSFWTAPIA